MVTPLEPYHSNMFGTQPPKPAEYTKSNVAYEKRCYVENFREMVRSAYRKGEQRCICTPLTPLLRTFQFLGIFPVSHDVSTCKITHSWKSFFAFISWIWFWGNIGVFAYVYAFASNFFSVFKGTDFYTIVLVVLSQFATTLVVFFAGNFMAAEFCKAWKLLHVATRDLYITNFSLVKRLTYFIPAYLLGEAVSSMIPVLFEKDPEMLAPPILIFFTAFIGNVIPNLMAASFSIMFWIIALYLDQVNEAVNVLLQESVREDGLTGNAVDGHADEVARLRNIHEDLCDSARHFSNAFGPQLLFVFGSTLFRFVAGLYGMSVTLTGLAPKQLAALTANNLVVSSLALFRIMLVLKSTEHTIKKSDAISETLKRALRPVTRESLRKEIDTFLNKLGSFPLEISCFGIHSLEPSYLSTAIPSIITYVLVLMQFRQGDSSTSAVQNSST